VSELALRQQVETLYQQTAASSQEFCIDLEGKAPDGRPVWEWMGYSRKDTATRSLSRLIEGVDFSAQVRESSGGRPAEQIRFSRGGFKQWGMLAGTDRGRQIRLYFIECEKRLQLGMSQPTALNQITDNLAQLSELVIGGFSGVRAELGELKEGQQLLADRVQSLERTRHRRKAVPEKHQRMYSQTVKESYGGACPCCRQQKPHMEFDHWYDRSRAGLDEVWLICTDCNRKLGAAGSPERRDYERQFYGFHDRLLDFTNGFQTELGV
jgi:hypothetical protein